MIPSIELMVSAAIKMGGLRTMRLVIVPKQTMVGARKVMAIALLHL